jgi:hypothetical protein
MCKACSVTCVDDLLLTWQFQAMAPPRDIVPEPVYCFRPEELSALNPESWGDVSTWRDPAARRLVKRIAARMKGVPQEQQWDRLMEIRRELGYCDDRG